MNAYNVTGGLEAYAARQEAEVLTKAATMEREGWQALLSVPVPAASAAASATTSGASKGSEPKTKT